MKRLLTIAVLSIFLLIGCKEEPNDNNNNQEIKDSVSLEITSHAMMDTLKRGESITWNKAGKSDYNFSICMAPVSTNDDDSIWDALARSSFSRANALTDTSFSNYQNTSRDQYIAVVVVKHPKSHTFKDWAKDLSVKELQAYMDIVILIGDGDMPIGTGCVGCCTTGSYTCPDGETTQTCKCVNEFCWKKLCGAYSKLEKIPEI